MINLKMYTALSKAELSLHEQKRELDRQNPMHCHVLRLLGDAQVSICEAMDLLEAEVL